MFEKILVECDECNGEGMIECQTDEGPYSISGMCRCNECDGLGEIFMYIETDENEQD